ncbi:MAG TPA: helix-turn-helix transcriptional regulator [Candidatus Limnocylindria bacterium]|nr:helix-turn-helix transcriptional regulator [Candidatus Limnocylindria bacterium]
MDLRGRALRSRVASVVRETRHALGWSQAELARRGGVSQSTVSRIEKGSIERLTFETAATVLETLGVQVSLEARTPLLGDRQRQRDAAHARCVQYVARRLERLGWLVATEVEVLDGRFRGWIDVLAYRPSDGMLLLIEIKTDLPDIGAVMRQQSWYERLAWAAARRAGWKPRRMASALLVLATARNRDRLAENGELLRRAFPQPARRLATLTAGEPAGMVGQARAIAMVDPYERSGRWLLATPLHGGAGTARYADYAAFMAHLRSGRRRPAA